MIIFTDLDGTLLDHETYSFEAARPALDAIKTQNVPLILASSKTAAEIAPLQKAIGINYPAIVENGAGIFWPDQTITEETNYLRIRDALQALQTNMRQCFYGFGDMGIEGIIETTGLAPDAAQFAATRAHSEPGIFTGTDAQKQAFIEALAPHGIKATQGGRFFTLSFGATKADRMAEIIMHFSKNNEVAAPSLALGDAPNDISMLEAADYGVIIRNDAHQTLPKLKNEANGRVTRTRKQGPTGWNDAVLSFLNRYAQS